jgi:hypothetical protein
LLSELIEYRQEKHLLNVKLESINKWIKEEAKEKRIYKKLSKALIKQKNKMINELTYSIDKTHRAISLLKNKKK